MQKVPVNTGLVDRAIRLIVAIALLWAVFNLSLDPLWTWLLSALALILLFTGLCGFCLIYSIFKIDTTGKKQG